MCGPNPASPKAPLCARKELFSHKGVPAVTGGWQTPSSLRSGAGCLGGRARCWLSCDAVKRLRPRSGRGIRTSWRNVKEMEWNWWMWHYPWSWILMPLQKGVGEEGFKWLLVGRSESTVKLYICRREGNNWNVSSYRIVLSCLRVIWLTLMGTKDFPTPFLPVTILSRSSMFPCLLSCTSLTFFAPWEKFSRWRYFRPRSVLGTPLLKMFCSYLCLTCESALDQVVEKWLFPRWV